MCLSDLKVRSSFSLRLIIGIAVTCTLLVLLIVGVGIYAMKQKSRAERALSLSTPFVSWGSSSKHSGDAPQLKGARCFPYYELKNFTDNFSERNEIGAGGYGKENLAFFWIGEGDCTLLCVQPVE